MKKYLLALIIVVIVIAAFSFTGVNSEKSKTNFYWFKLNSSTGNPKKSIGLPPYWASDPYSCLGGANFCAGSYPSYIDNGDGTYSAGGSRQITEMKP